MIKVRPLGRPRRRLRFRRELLESLPPAISLNALANRLGVNVHAVSFWRCRAGLPHIRKNKSYEIPKDEFIDWCISTGRVYDEEWPKMSVGEE